MMIDKCKKIPLFMFLIASPALLVDQVDIVFNYLVLRDARTAAENALCSVDGADAPGSAPYDDEEAELLFLSYAKDEEEEEKPLKRKAQEIA